MYPNYGNYSYLSNTQALNFITGMGTGMAIFLIALAVFEIVCMWKLFEKAGEPGWKCLIPIYNAYIFMKICWESKYFWIMLLLLLVPAVAVGLMVGGQSNALAGVAGFLMFAAYIAVGVIGIISLVKLAKRFGKSGAFAVGLIFLEPIFIAILAFDSSTYDRNLA